MSSNQNPQGPRRVLPREPANDTVGQTQRDTLWDLLLPPKGPGSESFVLKWPSSLDPMNRILNYYSEICSHLDDRWVRLMVRTETNAEGAEVITALILTPVRANLSVQDARVQLAMLYGWARLVYYVPRALSGDRMTLLQYLRRDTEHMVKQMQTRLGDVALDVDFSGVGVF